MNRGKKRENPVLGFRAGDYTKVMGYYFDSKLSIKGRTSRNELVTRITSPESGTFMLRQKYLRKVIQSHRKLGVFELHIPHSQEYTLPKADFLRIAKYELPDIFQSVEDWDEIPSMITLLSEPAPKELSNHSLDYFLHYFWSLLFHSEIHKLQIQWEMASIHTSTGINNFIENLGRDTFEEIRYVLEEENALFHPEDDREVFYEFVAYYLQFYNFAPLCLSNIFPLIGDKEKIYQEILRLGIDDEKLLQKSRLEGCQKLDEFLKQRNLQLGGQGEEFTIFSTSYHLSRIYECPEFTDLRLSRKEFVEKYEPMLRELISQTVAQTGIIGRLSFVEVVDAVAKAKIPLYRDQVLILDQILARAFTPLYKKASWFDRVIWMCRSEDFLQREKRQKKRVQIAEHTLERLTQIKEKVEKKRPSFLGKLFAFPFLLAFHCVWFFPRLFFSSLAFLFEKHYLWAQKLADGRRLRKFCRAFKEAISFHSKGNRAKAFRRYKVAEDLAREVSRRLVSSDCSLTKSVYTKAQTTLEEIEQEFAEEYSLDEEERQDLRVAFQFFLDLRQIRPHERKLIQDVQRSYLDARKKYFKMNIGGWLLSFGRKPLRLPLPIVPFLKKMSSLRSLQKRIYKLSLREEQLHAFLDLVDRAFSKQEHEFRHQFGSIVEQNLIEAGIKPVEEGLTSEEENAFSRGALREKIAFHKVKEEILDALIEKGHTKLTDLRDIISRNDLKLDDLGGIKEFLLGDQLLRIDKKMYSSLRGGHRRGEIYMRMIHRLGAALFGCSPGRWFSKYLLLPFGGSFVLLQIIFYLFGTRNIYYNTMLPLESILRRTLENYQASLHWYFLFTQFAWVVQLGLAILLLFYTQIGRKLAHRTFLLLWKVVKLIFVRFPKAIWNAPPVQFFYRWKLWRYLNIFILRPGIYSIPPILSMIYFTPALEYTSATKIILFWLCCANLVINTAFGRGIFDWIEENLEQALLQVNKTVFISIYRVTTEIFRASMQWIETSLYTIDDFFRFRQGDNFQVQFLKALFGKIWAVFNYVFRFTINLIVEPQINPIKHFPIVTISHKVLLSISPFLTQSSESFLAPVMGDFLWLGKGIVFLFIQFGLPGICGFIAWEFKENWKLYRYSSSSQIKPIMAGSHGETINGLLKPGFHSGTIPKLYRKIRKTAHPYHKKGNLVYRRKLEYQYHHICLYIQKFLERAFAAQFVHNDTISQKIKKIKVGAPSLFNRKIDIPVEIEADSRINFIIEYEFRSEVLLASVRFSSDHSTLPETLSSYLDFALSVLWKKSAVDILPSTIQDYVQKELQIDSEYRVECRRNEEIVSFLFFSSYSLEPEGKIIYHWDYEYIYPRVIQSIMRLKGTLPTVSREKLFLRFKPFYWEDYDQQLKKW